MSDKPEERTEKTVEEKKPVPQDQFVTTEHRITLDGKEIAYTVTTGTMVLKEESEKTGDKAGEAEGEKPKATVFFVAYTLKDVNDTAQRPITFSFNGGPGSASVWRHLGLLGPRAW